MTIDIHTELEQLKRCQPIACLDPSHDYLLYRTPRLVSKHLGKRGTGLVTARRRETFSHLSDGGPAARQLGTSTVTLVSLLSSPRPTALPSKKSVECALSYADDCGPTQSADMGGPAGGTAVCLPMTSSEPQSSRLMSPNGTATDRGSSDWLFPNDSTECILMSPYSQHLLPSSTAPRSLAATRKTVPSPPGSGRALASRFSEEKPVPASVSPATRTKASQNRATACGASPGPVVATRRCARKLEENAVSISTSSADRASDVKTGRAPRRAAAAAEATRRREVAAVLTLTKSNTQPAGRGRTLQNVLADVGLAAASGISLLPAARISRGYRKGDGVVSCATFNTAREVTSLSAPKNSRTPDPIVVRVETSEAPPAAAVVAATERLQRDADVVGVCVVNDSTAKLRSLSGRGSPLLGGSALLVDDGKCSLPGEAAVMGAPLASDTVRRQRSVVASRKSRSTSARASRCALAEPVTAPSMLVSVTSAGVPPSPQAMSVCFESIKVVEPSPVFNQLSLSSCGPGTPELPGVAHNVPTPLLAGLAAESDPLTTRAPHQPATVSPCVSFAAAEEDLLVAADCAHDNLTPVGAEAPSARGVDPLEAGPRTARRHSATLASDPFYISGESLPRPSNAPFGDATVSPTRSSGRASEARDKKQTAETDKAGQETTPVVPLLVLPGRRVPANGSRTPPQGGSHQREEKTAKCCSVM